jgi:hypothetical protein
MMQLRRALNNLLNAHDCESNVDVATEAARAALYDTQ